MDQNLFVEEKRLREPYSANLLRMEQSRVFNGEANKKSLRVIVGIGYLRIFCEDIVV